MPAPAPSFAISISQPLHVAAGDVHGDLLAIGWNPSDRYPAGVSPYDGLVYLVLDRSTGSPAWIGEHEVRGVRHEHHEPV